MKFQSNIHVLSFLRSSVNAASIVVFGVGLVVLLGWVMALPALRSIVPGLPAIRFNTALSFLLLGSSLWFLQNEEASHAQKGIGKTLTSLALVISLLTLSEYLFGWDLGIDELFIRDLDSPPDLFPGRVSPIAVLCASLSSVGLLMLGSRISQYFSIGVIVLSLVAIMDFLFDFRALSRSPQNTYIAVQTAGTFLILALALLAARPSRGMMKILSSDLPGSKAMRLLLPGIVILTVLMGWLVEQAENIGVLDTSKESIFLVILLIFVYSPLIYFIARNINRAEERITYINRLYATLSQVNQTIVRVKSQQELFESICKVAVNFGGLRLAWVGLLDSETGQVTPVAECSDGQSKLPFQSINVNEAPFQQGLIGMSLLSGQVKFSDDVRTDLEMNHWRETAIKGDYHSAAAIPIRQHGQIIGLLNLYAADIGFFTVKEEQSLLEEMGFDISFALDTMENETERKRIQEELQHNEQVLRLFVENSPAAIAMFDREMKYLVVSRRFLSDYELGDQNVIGRSYYEVFPEIPERWKEIHRRCLAGETERADEDPFPRTSGKLDWVRWEIRPWYETYGEIGGIILFSEVVTERKQAEEAMLESERQMRALVTSLDDIVFEFDEQGTYLNVWAADESLLAQPKDQLVGRQIVEVLGEENSRPFAETIKRVLASGQPESIEYPLEVIGGQRWFLARISPIHSQDGSYRTASMLIRDITERKRAEAQILRQLQRLNGLRAIDVAISSSFDIRVTLDVVLQQVVSQLDVDAAAILLFDPPTKTIEYAASRGFRSDVLHHTQSKLSEGYADRAVRERRTIHIPDLLKAGGKLAKALQLAKEDFVDYYGTPLITKEEIKGVLEIYQRSPLISDPEWLGFLETLAGQAAIAIDNAQLWEQVQLHASELERRVAERTTELNRMNIELEHANRTKDEFLATMSHELRTPLNSVLGLSESLLEQRRDPLSEYQQRSLQIIASSGSHLLELINDILDLSKIEAGRFDYYPQIITVNELCRSSLAFVKEQATRKFIAIIYQEETPVSKVYADPRRLKQILVNLLTNAVKFTPAHGQVILQVRADAEQDRIQFSVFDNGIGIALEDLRQLFVPFSQVDSSLTREYEGTGLGLALVQKLTDLHGGSVDVESEVGKGSRFTINLPMGLAIVARQEAIEAGGELLINKQAEKSNRSSDKSVDQGIVLLAEDNMANILTIGDYLESHGYQVVVAHDGLEAIEEAEELKPNIILMDIQMPALDGLEAIRRLRADSRFASTPIIALTALAMPGDRERCLEAGANEYMSKPISLKTMLNTIEKLSGYKK